MAFSHHALVCSGCQLASASALPRSEVRLSATMQHRQTAQAGLAHVDVAASGCASPPNAPPPGRSGHGRPSLVARSDVVAGLGAAGTQADSPRSAQSLHRHRLDGASRAIRRAQAATPWRDLSARERSALRVRETHRSVWSCAGAQLAQLADGRAEPCMRLAGSVPHARSKADRHRFVVLGGREARRASGSDGMVGEGKAVQADGRWGA